MNFNWVNNIKSGVKVFGSKVGVFARENGPSIEVYGGIALLVAGGIYGMYQSTKLEETLDECKVIMDEAKKTDEKKEVWKARGKCGFKIAKLYGGPIALMTGGGVAIHAGYSQKANAYTLMAGAYTALDNQFKKYDKNLTDMLGEDMAKKVRYGLVDEVVETDDKDTETGAPCVKKSLKTLSKTSDGSNGSQYTFLYDELNIYGDRWENDIWRNLKMIQNNLRIAQKQFNEQGYLFLNEFYRIMGLRKEFMSPLGWKVGWIKPNHKCPNEMDNGFNGLIHLRSIGFGYGGEDVMDLKVDEIYQYEPNMCLEPNVQGVIADRVTKMLAGREDY